MLRCAKVNGEERKSEKKLEAYCVRYSLLVVKPSTLMCIYALLNRSRSKGDFPATSSYQEQETLFTHRLVKDGCNVRLLPREIRHMGKG